MSVILIGYRGSGKTTIGRKLADRLWLPFVDSDERIVAKAGKSIREIFEQDGESTFRDLEQAIVEELCRSTGQIVSLGGGAILREANRKAIRASSLKCVYLHCEPSVLHQRIHADPATAANRPALTHLGGGEDEIRKLLEIREPLYREVMDAEIDVTNLTPDEAIVFLTRLI